MSGASGESSVALEHLILARRPKLHEARMVIGMSGWMDGGDVSSGTVGALVRMLRAEPIGHIEPEDFYIYNFPGSMEIAAMFRPHCRIVDGIVKRLSPPTNVLYANDEDRLILFEGKEPNLHWSMFGECLFAAAHQLGVTDLFYVGSVAGIVPHTREPRLFCSVSEESLKECVEPIGARFSDYEGPAGFSTYLTHEARKRGLRMVTLVAEIPAYIQGRNPLCIESVVRRLAGLLRVHLPLEEMRTVAEAFEERLEEAVKDREELQDLVRKLESDYDSEVFDSQMGDLKDWLQKKGIRLD